MTGTLTRITTWIAARYHAWRQPPWEFATMADSPRGYQVWSVASPCIAIAVTALAIGMDPDTFAIHDWLYTGVAVAICAYLSQLVSRKDSQMALDNGAMVSTALLIAGRPGAALVCVAISKLVSAARKPAPLHAVIANVTDGLITIIAMQWLFVTIASDAHVLSTQWLLAAIGSSAAWCITLFVGLGLSGVLGGFMSFRESLEMWRTGTLDTFRVLMPSSMLVGAAITGPSAWHLGLLFIPQLITNDVFARTEELVETESRHDQLRQTFSTYVPSSVVDQLVDQGIAIDLGGEQKSISVLFCDIRGFTAWSEHLPATEVVKELNVLLAALSDAVFATDGTLDKFTGDGLMAFWGAPLEQPDHAARAVQTAELMISSLADVNAKRALDGQPHFAIGIGVHSGLAVVGNVGHSERHDYTAIGDTVNLSARIEAETKAAGLALLMSEATCDLLPGEMQMRCHKVGERTVKGRREPVALFGAHTAAEAPQAAA